MKRLMFSVLVVLALIGAALSYRQFVLVPPLKDRVLKLLKDPASAQFRDLHYYGDWTVSSGLLCGEVNAKNAIGGYVGFRSFTADAKQGTIERDTKLSEYCGHLKLDAPWWWIRW